METTKEAMLETMISFLHSIGIKTSFETIKEETFLPGILINKGALVIDLYKLLYPGDILHEAGHIAVMTAEERQKAIGNIGETKEQSDAGGEELAAIAWSYAALKYLKLPITLLFHPNGYKGASDWYIKQFESGTYVALPLLQWFGLCYDQKQAELKGVAPYPHMIKWLRD